MPDDKLPNNRELVLLAILKGGEKYGRELRTEYEKRARSSMPLGSLYTTLDRMEEKGFVKSRDGEATLGRSGNRRRYFQITGKGSSMLSEAQRVAAFLMGAARA